MSDPSSAREQFDRTIAPQVLAKPPFAFYQSWVRSALAEDVLRGLARRPRSIPPKYFYDDAGSVLFDRICELDEYYPTRTERALLERWSDDIATRADASVMIELGSGMARKTGHLLRAMSKRAGNVVYVPLDISPAALEASKKSIEHEVPSVVVRPIVGDFACDLARVREIDRGGARLFAFLGSTIGNLDEEAAPALLRLIAREMRPGDSFVLGLDLVKDRGTLLRAYDDAEGVTALFNKNVLAVINRELGADFDLDAWAHEARWNESRARIEMHLRATRPMRVGIPSIDVAFETDLGETILTEISRKFTRESGEQTLRAGGMSLDRWYTDDAAWFALAFATKA